MNRRRDGTKDFYSLVSPTFRCNVWHTANNDWVASIRYGDQTRHKENFPTNEAARQWCEQRILTGKAGRPI